MNARRPTAVFALFLTLLVAACGPPVAPWGEGTTPPHIADDVLVTHDGLQLPLHVWLPEKKKPDAVVLALHGFNDYSNAFADVGPWLAGEGIAVYAWDQRGFGGGPRAGEWAGTDALVADVRNVVRLVRHRHPGARVVLVGESMGGAVAMAAMASPDPPDVDGLVLAAPAVWGRDAMPWYQRAVLEVMARVAPSLELSGRGLGLWPSDNREMLQALSSDPLIIKKTRVQAVYGLVDLMDAAQSAAGRLPVPTLWLYGARDELVPPQPTLTAARRLDPDKGQRFVLYPNGWHMLLRDLQAETVLTDIAAWVRDPDAPLPSGAEADPATVRPF